MPNLDPFSKPDPKIQPWSQSRNLTQPLNPAPNPILTPIRNWPWPLNPTTKPNLDPIPKSDLNPYFEAWLHRRIRPRPEFRTRFFSRYQTWPRNLILIVVLKPETQPPFWNPMVHDEGYKSRGRDRVLIQGRGSMLGFKVWFWNMFHDDGWDQVSRLGSGYAIKLEDSG